METVIIATIVVFLGFYIILKIISWVCTGLSDWLWMRKANKQNAAVAAQRKSLDEEAKQYCGDDWVAQMNYKVKKSLFTLREIRAKDHPEEFYRDEKGFLQDIKKPKKENKIELKTKAFKCSNCGAPLSSVNEDMKGTCAYCGTTVAFLQN